jgi:hypothetical protein
MAEIASVRLLNAAREEVGAAPTKEDVYIRLRMKVRKPGTLLRGQIDVSVKNAFLFRSTQPQEVAADHRGVFDLLVRVPAQLLGETTYWVTAVVYTRLGDKESKVVLDRALTFMAYAETFSGEELRTPGRSGAIAPRLDWDIKSHTNARKQQRDPVA